MAIRIPLFAAALAALVGTAAHARQFSPGNLVVCQVGDGAAALSSSATLASLLEFTTAGSQVGGALGLPTAVAGSNRRLTLSGTATSEGFLTLSRDGRFLTMGGYDADLGTASITSSNSSAINRVVARINGNMIIDTSTAIADAATPGNIRSACSDDGSGFWVGTSGGGVRYAAFGATSSTQLNTTAPTNTRVTNIFAGQLYMSAASGTFQGVGTLGAGLPTAAGQTPALLNGFPTAAGPSSYDYFFSDASTLYVADDRAVASGGGIQKWVLSSGTWGLAYTLNTSLSAGVRGLCGLVDPNGAVTLYATTSQSSANQLVGVTDIGASSSFALLATAPANTAFRGVDFAPVPTPGTLGLIGAAGLLAARRRR